MELFCSDCGAKLVSGSKFCTQCGSKVILSDEQYVFKKGQSRLDTNRQPPNNASENEVISIESANFKRQSPAKVFVLSLVTLGIYNLILLYRWIETLNKVRDRSIIDPTLAIVLSVITCGIASIYYDYQVVKEYELLIKELGGQKNSIGNLNPPPNNLKDLVLYGNIFIIVLSFVSVGTLWVLTWFASAYLVLLIQKAVEYSLLLKSKSE
tara:strand:+ start:74 stop:703 length:630 start_codon:yes stop_codon:yes gene_type:complete